MNTLEFFLAEKDSVIALHELQREGAVVLVLPAYEKEILRIVNTGLSSTDIVKYIGVVKKCIGTKSDCAVRILS